VTLNISVAGLPSDTFFIFINRPYKLVPPVLGPQYTESYNGDGYTTVIAYSAQDLCTSTMHDFDANEALQYYTVSPLTFIPDQTPDTWRGGPQGGGHIYGQVLGDTISFGSSILNCTDLIVPCKPKPQNPIPPLGSEKVDHTYQTVYVGSVTPGLGQSVQKDVLQRYRDHGDHLIVTTPYP
jgi:hypothetical protein